MGIQLTVKVRTDEEASCLARSNGLANAEKRCTKRPDSFGVEYLSCSHPRTGSRDLYSVTIAGDSCFLESLIIGIALLQDCIFTVYVGGRNLNEHSTSDVLEVIRTKLDRLRQVSWGSMS